MNKYLIFRTDKIGDFLLTAILIKSIKRNDPSSHITIVASEKNFNYIKSFKNVDQVLLLKKGLINRFNLIRILNKYKYKVIILHDSKKRSSFISFFLKTSLKIKPNTNLTISHFLIIKDILNKLNFNFEDSDLNFLDNRSYEKSIKLPDNFIQLHFDEKWIHSEYIADYVKIEPNENQLISFLNLIQNKTDKNIIVTTGINSPTILDKIFLNKFNSRVSLLEKLNFFEIEYIVGKSDALISCHGAISHVASAKNIKLIDIINNNNTVNAYNKWTAHFRNYYPIYRKIFSELSDDIIKLL